MLIKVHYHDTTYGIVDDTVLEDLIGEDMITGFYRSTGWVRIGRDPIRKHRAERRKRHSLLNLYI